MHDPDAIATETLARRASGHLLLLLDFDGTLAEFDPDPAAVYLPPARRELLMALMTLASVGIVSGRRLEDVRQRCGVDGGIFAGMHGMEIEVNGERFIHPGLQDIRPQLELPTRQLVEAAASLPGAFVEQKGTSVVLHYRDSDPASQERAVDLFDRIAADHVRGGQFRVMSGSFMRELMPNIHWGKGDAVRWIHERVERRHGPTFVVYAGDDVTDQPALEAAATLGLAVAASDRVRAGASVDGPAGVERFLRSLQSAASSGRRQPASDT